MTVRIRLRLKRARLAAFVHPFEKARRTAVLTRGFEQTATVRVFAEGWCGNAAAWKPEVVAGRIEQLRELARQGYVATHGLVVFLDSPDELLSEEERRSLWTHFGVPVFEQLLDGRKRLLASECDAHAGLHVVGNCTGLVLDEARCMCGNTTPRLARVLVRTRSQHAA